MKNFIKKVGVYAGAHKIISAIISIAVIIEVIALATGAGNPTIPTYTLTAARLGTISKTVSGTGQVEGQSQVNVTPQGSGGQVTAINVAPGQMVRQGQTLVTLNDQTALSSLDQAQANVASAQANYDKVVEGLTPEEIAADQATVTNATQSLVAELISAYTQTNNLIRTSIDPMFTNPTTAPLFNLSFLDTNGNLVTFTSNDPVLVVQINSERSQLNTLLPTWESDVASLSLQTGTSSPDLASHVNLALNDLQYVANFLNDLSNAVYGISAQYTKYASNISSYKSTVASALQTIDSQISSVTSSNQSLTTAQVNYNVNTAPPTNASVQSAQASLISAQASLQSAQIAYNDTRITAPFSGQVGDINVQVGDVVSGSTAVATIVTTQKIADISLNEVDAATVHVGDRALLTFNALPNVTIPAYVSEMSLVGTVSSGVVDYDVKLALATSTANFADLLRSSGQGSGQAGMGRTFQRAAGSSSTGAAGFSSTTIATFEQNAQKNLTQALTEIKPGMSVTATITTQSDSNVVLVPSSAVKSNPGGRGSYVQTLPDTTTAGTVTTKATPQNVPVTTGITNGTETEITSGLSAGDLIVTQGSSAGSATISAAAAAVSRGGGFGGGRAFFGG